MHRSKPMAVVLGTLALSLCAAVYAQSSAPSAHSPVRLTTRHDTPTQIGIATELSKERLGRIDRLMQQYVDENRIAGAVVLILQDGDTAYEHAAGWSDKEAGTRMAADSIFRIASQSKALTSVAILMLMEEGKLALNNPVSTFIPEFAKTTVMTKTDSGMRPVPAARQITIRDLLTHTAGISYGMEPQISALYEAKGLGPAAGKGWYTADKDEPICTTMARLASLPFREQPGDAFVYGYNTDILGCVVERASGKPLDVFLRERITGPLGMKDTQFYLPKDQRRRLAAVYGSGADGRIVRAPNDSKGQGHYVDGPRKSFSGGAGLLSTARDYARFMEMIRNGGTLDGVRYLSPRSVALMTTNQIGTLHPKGTGLGFGLGFETVERYGANGMDSVGAFGWGGAYGSQYRVDPTSGLVVVIMMQMLPNETDFRDRLWNLIYDSLLPPGG